MLKDDVLKYFDPKHSRPTVTARAIGVTPGAISQWDEFVPELTARRISEMTRGKLKFRAEKYKRGRAAVR